MFGGGRSDAESRGRSVGRSVGRCEVLDGEKVGISSDVWSLGILLYLTLCGELPVDVKDNSMEKDVAILKKGNFPMHVRCRRPPRETETTRR